MFTMAKVSLVTYVVRKKDSFTRADANYHDQIFGPTQLLSLSEG